MKLRINIEKPTRQLALATGIYALLTLAMFAPVLGHLTDSLIGPPEDNMLFCWNLWWQGEAMIGPDKGLYSGHLFFPQGHSLLMHSMSWFNSVLGGLMSLAIPLALAYNLLILVGFVAGGAAAFALTRRYVSGFLPCLVSGYVFAFNPFHFAQSLHHLNIATIQFIPLFILFHERAIESGKKSDLMMSGIFFAISAFASWYFMVFQGLYLVFRAGLVLATDRVGVPRELKTSSLVLALALALLLPVLGPMLVFFMDHSQAITRQALDPMRYYVADLAALFRANDYHPLWGGPERDFAAPFTSNTWETQMQLGFGVVLLGALGLAKRFKRALPVAVMAGLFLLMSLGTVLHVQGREYGPAILPYKLFQLIPGLAVARIPARMIIMVHLFLGILAAMGLQWLLKDKTQRTRMALAAVFCVLILAEFFSMTSAHTPVEMPHAYTVAGDDNAEAILDLPVDGYKLDRLWMLYQTGHGLPLAGGVLARTVDRGILEDLQGKHPGQMRAILSKNGITHLMVHKKFFPHPPNLVFGRDFQRIYEDESQALFRVP